MLYADFWEVKDVYQHINKEEILLFVTSEESKYIKLETCYKDFIEKMKSTVISKNDSFINVDDSTEIRFYDGTIQMYTKGMEYLFKADYVMEM